MKKSYIVLVMILVFVIFLISLVLKEKEEANIPNEVATVQIVKDYNEYFTILNSINKFMTLYEAKDVNNLLLVLDESYIKENELNVENVLSHLQKLGNSNIYKSELMYKEKNNDFINYYTKGKLYYDDLDSEKELSEHYFQLIKDVQNNTFSIKLIDNNVFEGKINQNQRGL